MLKQASTTIHVHKPEKAISQIEAVLSRQNIESALEISVKILRQSFDHYDWVGIYLVKGEMLELAAYDGESETEHVRIPIGQGICGAAAREGHTILVPDVNKDPRYLACFASTRSEIVIPIFGKDTVLGEIDIDSDKPSAFDDEDQETLEGVARMLAHKIESK